VDSRLRRCYRLKPAAAELLAAEAALLQARVPSRDLAPETGCTRAHMSNSGCTRAHMSNSADRERHYRRLLARYPLALRRERAQEILAVLMPGPRSLSSGRHGRQRDPGPQA